MECCCYLRNIQDILSDGKTPDERRFGKPFYGPVVPFGAMVEYHPISAKDLSRLHQFGSKVLPGKFLRYVLSAAGIWKGDMMVADNCEELEEMDASELHARNAQCKEVLTPMQGENIMFPGQTEQSKISGENQDLRASTLIWESPDRGEEQDTLRGESDGSSSTRDKTHHGMMVKPEVFIWSIAGDFIYGHHVEPRVKLYVPTEESFSIPLKYIGRYQDYRHDVRCAVGETHWRSLERWWRKRNFGCMDRLHENHCTEREATCLKNMVRVTDLTRKETTSRPDNGMARYVEAHVWFIETQR